MQVLFIIWIIFLIIYSIYKLVYQYKNAIDQPATYKKVRSILSYIELVVMMVLVINAFFDGIYLYILVIPVSILIRLIINFITFKRESDKLCNLYINGNNMDPQKALELANDMINERIKNKKLI